MVKQKRLSLLFPPVEKGFEEHYLLHKQTKYSLLPKNSHDPRLSLILSFSLALRQKFLRAFHY